jgi:hypothetical protein
MTTSYFNLTLDDDGSKSTYALIKEGKAAKVAKAIDNSIDNSIDNADINDTLGNDDNPNSAARDMTGDSSGDNTQMNDGITTAPKVESKGIHNTILNQLTNEDSECRLENNLKAPSKDVCSPPEVIDALKRVYPSAAKSSKEVVNNAMNESGCKSESCLYTTKEVLAIVGTNTMKNMLKKHFRPFGPAFTKELVSDMHIDENLAQWSTIWPDFHNFKFQMIDFKAQNNGKGTDIVTTTLNNIYSSGKRTFGFVINTDLYSGGGKHWMAVFGDMRSNDEWSVEFFNSSSRPPHLNIQEWMEDKKKEMRSISSSKGISPKIKLIRVVIRQLQFGMSECGIYSLYYIMARLYGEHYSVFNGKVSMKDDLIEKKIRPLLFNHLKKPNEQKNSNVNTYNKPKINNLATVSFINASNTSTSNNTFATAAGEYFDVTGSGEFDYFSI